MINTDATTLEAYAKNVELSSLFKLSYGLFVLSAKEGAKQNGCIINTVMQVTNTPNRILIAVNKQNYTHNMIVNTGEFNVSVLSTDVPFSVFERFGFASGRDTDKYEGFDKMTEALNGIYRLYAYSNAFISGKVVEMTDCGTHTVFIADITEAHVLSDVSSVTYDYYFKHIKPQPTKSEKKKGFVCKICGYVYEGDTLPDDFICPLCKHGASDFEPLS